jgi:hypothetical protein
VQEPKEPGRTLPALPLTGLPHDRSTLGFALPNLRSNRPSVNPDDRSTLGFALPNLRSNRPSVNPADKGVFRALASRYRGYLALLVIT